MLQHFEKKKRGGRRSLAIWLGASALLLMAGVLVFADVRMYHKRQELNAQVKALQSKIADTKKSNDQLQQGISQADNEQYIEKVAREQLDLQKPGEKVVSFVQPSGQQTAAVAAKQNFLQSWLGWIGGWFKK